MGKIDVISINGEWTFLTDGTKISTHRFNKIEHYKKDVYFVKLGKLWGIFDSKKDEFLVDIQYKKIEKNDDKKGLLEVKDVKNKCGYITLDNSITVPTIYDYLFYHKDKNIVHATKNKKNGVISLENDVIVDFLYDTSYIDFWRNRLIVSIKEKFGVINFKGDVIIPLIYNKLKGDKKKSYIVIDEIGKYGIINESNEILVPLEYDLIYEQYTKGKNFYLILKGLEHQHYGIMDKETYDIVLPIGDYHIEQIIDTDRIVLRQDKGKDKYFGLIVKGKMVIPFKPYWGYYHGYDYYDRLLFQTSHYKYDVYTLDGEFERNCEMGDLK